MNQREIRHMPDLEQRGRGRFSIGRGVRLLLGALLLGAVIPVYSRVTAAFFVMTILLLLGLVGAYSLLHVVLSRRRTPVNRWLGAILALVIVVGVYLVGSPGGLLFGGGEGQLAALTFLSVSLIVAAIRGDLGCEVMSIPGALVGRPTHLACVVLSPVDALERALRARRAV